MRTLLISGNGRWALLDKGARQSGASVIGAGCPFAEEAGMEVRKIAAFMTADEWTRFCKPEPKQSQEGVPAW